MKKILLLLFVLIFNGCNSPESTAIQEDSNTAASVSSDTKTTDPSRLSGGMETYPYPTLLENPDYDMTAAFEYWDETGDFPSDLNMNISETYDAFNPVRLLEEDPLSLLPNFAGYDYETKQSKNDMDPEVLEELQSIALQLETPAIGEGMTVSEMTQLSTDDWQEPVVFFTNLQKLNPIGHLDFVPSDDYAYHYRDDEYGDYEDCDGFTDGSYTPFLLERNGEGKVISIRTSFSSTTRICGPSGGGAGTYLDLLVRLDEGGRLSRITGIYPDRDELNEGPLFVDYTFYYRSDNANDYTIRFIASNFDSTSI